MNDDGCCRSEAQGIERAAREFGRDIVSPRLVAGVQLEDGPCGETCCEAPGLACGESGPGRVRDISISQVNYGYIVKVGCHTFAFETADRLIEKLGTYLKEPNKTESRWYKGTLL